MRLPPLGLGFGFGLGLGLGFGIASTLACLEKSSCPDPCVFFFFKQLPAFPSTRTRTRTRVRIRTPTRNRIQKTIEKQLQIISKQPSFKRLVTSWCKERDALLDKTLPRVLPSQIREQYRSIQIPSRTICPIVQKTTNCSSFQTPTSSPCSCRTSKSSCCCQWRCASRTKFSQAPSEPK